MEPLLVPRGYGRHFLYEKLRKGNGGPRVVILLFLLMIWRFMIIANNASDLYGALVVVGIMAHLSIQVILNIAVVTNTIPNTGISLPFISYLPQRAVVLSC